MEEENASLQEEYERLRHKSQSTGHPITPSEELKLDHSNGSLPPLNGNQHKPNFYPSMDSNENNIVAEGELLPLINGLLNLNYCCQFLIYIFLHSSPFETTQKQAGI